MENDHIVRSLPLCRKEKKGLAWSSAQAILLKCPPQQEPRRGLTELDVELCWDERRVPRVNPQVRQRTQLLCSMGLVRTERVGLGS